MTAALGAPTIAAASESVPYCSWNRALVQDQYVSYSGYTDATVGVVFIDNSPFCQVQVVCWGTFFVCLIPALP